MCLYDSPLAIALSDALAKVTDEFIQRIQLFLTGAVLIVIADEADPDSDAVQIIAVHVTSAHLFTPPGTDFDLTVARGGAVSDDEMVGESVGHFADVRVVIIERLCISLPRSAVVNDDVFPASGGDFSPIDFVTNGLGEVLVVSTGGAASTEDALPERRSFELFHLQFDPGFLNDNWGIWIWNERSRLIFAYSLRGCWDGNRRRDWSGLGSGYCGRRGSWVRDFRGRRFDGGRLRGSGLWRRLGRGDFFLRRCLDGRCLWLRLRRGGGVCGGWRSGLGSGCWGGLHFLARF